MKKLLIVLLLFITQFSCINIKKPVPDALKTKKVKIDILITLSFKENKNFNIKENDIEKRLKERLKQSLLSFSPECNTLNYNFIDSEKESASPLLLKIDLSGYGKIKRQWVSFLFKMGLLEALSQGIIVYTATHNTLLSFGVAGEEVASEYITWYGGSFLFSKTYEPVTIEGHLYRRGNNKLLWRRIVVVTKNKKAYKKLSEKNRKDKKIILKINLEKAETEFFSSLKSYLKSNFCR